MMVVRLQAMEPPVFVAHKIEKARWWERHTASYWAGLSTLLLFTAGLTMWLVYHWFFHPELSTQLPVLMQELIDLVEWAGVFSLSFIWAGLWWRKRMGWDEPEIDLPELSLEDMYELAPAAFERYVAGLFRMKGYRVVVRGKTGDHGVDVEIFGQEGGRAIVQCKRYQTTVGEEVVRDLYGTMMHEKVGRAFLITTADISLAARRWAANKPITLIDGETLVAIAHSIRERIQEEDKE